MSCHLKKLSSDDITQICAIAAQCFNESWSEEDYRYFVTHECAYSFGLFSQDHELACYLLSLRVQGDLDIISVATHPACRRLGLAARLLSQAIDDVQTRRLMLEVDVGNVSAISLYLKLGFKVQGIRKKYYDASRDAYFMTFSKDDPPTALT